MDKARREIEIKALRAAEAYRDHRDTCKICREWEPCPVGLVLLRARQEADAVTFDYQ